MASMPLYLPMGRLDLEKLSLWKAINMMKQSKMKEQGNLLFKKKKTMVSQLEQLERSLGRLKKREKKKQ
jgi:hypothetical protein